MGVVTSLQVNGAPPRNLFRGGGARGWQPI